MRADQPPTTTAPPLILDGSPEVQRESMLTPGERLAPARRPDGSPVAWQDWRNILLMHWPLAPHWLAPLLPDGLTVDLFRGTAWLSVVIFEGRRSRVSGIASGLAVDVLEVHVRTYVHAGRVPGVFAFTRDASSHLAVAFSRIAMGLPCSFASIEHAIAGRDVVARCVRHAGHRPSLDVEAKVGDRVGLAKPGTIDHFLLERYVLYARRMGSLVRTRVHHAPVLARQAVATTVIDELVPAAGLPGFTGPPPLTHWLAGVDMAYFAGEKVRST